MTSSVEIDALREYLIRRRKELGRTQAEVARRMGTTQSALSDLEGGRTVDPSLNTLARWAAGIDVELTVQAAEIHRHIFPVVPRFTERKEEE